MEVWGSPANVKWTMSDKLVAKSNSCLLVGYPKGTNGYQFYTSLEQKVFISKHVVFIEKEILLEDSGSKVELREVQNTQTDATHLIGPQAVIHSHKETVDPFEAQVLRKTGRTRTVQERYGFLINEQRDVLLIGDDEPTTYEESLNSSKSDKWLVAMKLEMDSMYTNQVWTLVDQPKGIKPIGCKWVLKKKTDMEGNVTYKTRLVAKGY